MARCTKEQAERTRSRIMASALSLFAQKGYERTTFNDIAAKLKLTKGAVYWHFESKEALLMALVDDMLENFSRQFTALDIVHGADANSGCGLTFGLVADIMVETALRVIENPTLSSFFILMKCQMKWRNVSMSKIRENIIANDKFGPMQAFQCAIKNEIAAGRVRKDVDAVQVSTVCLAIWDGLVQSRLDGFLACDLKETLKKSYSIIWDSLKIRE